MKTVIVIPAEGPVQEIELIEKDGLALAHLQEIVGGFIEALPIPIIDVQRGGIPEEDAARCTAYINEEGKFLEGCKPNYFATDFFVPGVGLGPGDHIAGTLVLAGANPRFGTHTERVPQSVIERVRLIASEAGRELRLIESPEPPKKPNPPAVRNPRSRRT